jgi:NAD(P)H-binding
LGLDFRRFGSARWDFPSPKSLIVRSRIWMAAIYEAEGGCNESSSDWSSGQKRRALVNEALAAGHKVTAFVRGAAQYKKANVRVVAGDVLDAAAVDVAVAGQDAVTDVLGGKTPLESDDDGNERGTQYCGCDAMACGGC